MMFNWFSKKKEPSAKGRSRPKTLCDVCEGESVRIECLTGDTNDCQRLREMGFCEKSRVEKISGKKTLICRVCDTKVVISHGLAKNIIIGECTEEGDVMTESGQKIVLLSELKQGQQGAIHDFSEENDACARLEEMGVTPGEVVQVIRYAPMGDPIEIKIRGYHLSLRKEEAELIQVRI